MAVFGYQYHHNEIYRQFCNAIHRTPATIQQTIDIPFLPISFFKTHRVVADTCEFPELLFESSGTTGDVNSRHYVQDAKLYEQSLLAGFRQFYGEPQQYAIIGLLPSYLERQNASLVYMSKVLMEHSGHPDCGFYLNEFDKLSNVLARLEAVGQKVLLIGVTFALLDFAEAYSMQLKHTTVMETGGMKGRRQEMTRTQVHDTLKQQWQVDAVHSEYGMTELLSQAYALQDGIFQPSATMKVLVRDINDPMEVRTSGNGCLNIIDLANLHSCSFIATEDIGSLRADGSFEVLGRMDHAALRGCSLMAV
ncbi:MAG: acyl transferase [Sphingobacteriales bacterium]|nr:MAG: acyl transferase [Sphingobacteriales bacterium]